MRRVYHRYIPNPTFLNHGKLKRNLGNYIYDLEARGGVVSF